MESVYSVTLVAQYIYIQHMHYQCLWILQPSIPTFQTYIFAPIFCEHLIFLIFLSNHYLELWKINNKTKNFKYTNLKKLKSYGISIWWDNIDYLHNKLVYILLWLLSSRAPLYHNRFVGSQDFQKLLNYRILYHIGICNMAHDLNTSFHLHDKHYSQNYILLIYQFLFDL